LIKLLAGIFIKNRDRTDDPRVRSAYGMLCGIVGILLNLILFGVKLLAGIISGAVSVISDAFNNLTDAASSLITLIGFRMSGQKPDKDHPFGHGRIEYLSGLVVSVLIILVGFELGKSSVGKIISPEPVTFSMVSVVILGCAILAKGYMALYNFSIGKKIGSAAMTATATDSLSDMIATSAVLCGLLIFRFTGVNLDPYFGLAVSAFILFSGIRSVKETVDPLLGTPPDEEFIGKIEEIVYSYDGVVGIHDLIVHDYGPARRMISLHAEVPADADLLETHDMIDNIEKALREALHCDAVIHMDPIVTEDAAVLSMRETICEMIHGIDENLSVHDFRMVSGSTHTNLIFDVVLPYKVRITEGELISVINEKVAALDGNYFAVVNVDRPIFDK